MARRRRRAVPKTVANGQAERSERYLEKQDERGLKQVKVWVPADQRDKLIAYAEKLRG